MVKRILVTGASGFIGRHTVQLLEDEGFYVIRGVRRPVDEKESEYFIYIDLNNPEQILALEESIHCDAIVHLGAVVGLNGAGDSDLFLPNVLSSGCIAHLARSWDAHLIFASSVMVNGSKTEKIQLDSPLNPDTPYGRSKALSEMLLQASGTKYCVLRLAGVFGFNGPAHLGLNRAITTVINGGLPTQIGSGRALRNYVYVKDVAKAICHAIEVDLRGIHLVAGGEVLSISEMLQLLCDEFRFGKQPVIRVGGEATDQIISPSTYLPKSRSFQEALNDIHKEISV